MNYTKNYKFGLPELDEQYDLNVVNNNNTEIDTELKNNADAINKEAQDRAQEIKQHKNNKNNPHEVTKEQVGLGKVENKNLDELFDLICPVGTIEYSATTRTEENHWLLCDGREITREKYPKLYDAIGHIFNPDYDPNRLDSDQRVLLPNQLTADGKPRALYGADTSTYKVGTYIEESLPQHRHLEFSKGQGYQSLGSDNKHASFNTQWNNDYSYTLSPSQPQTEPDRGLSGKAIGTVYKDNANVFTNGIAVNMYIRW